MGRHADPRLDRAQAGVPFRRFILNSYSSTIFRARSFEAELEIWFIPQRGVVVSLELLSASRRATAGMTTQGMA